MVWPVVAAMAAGAVMSHQRSQQQEAQQRAQQRKMQRMEAAKARYSPWTGFSPDTRNIPAVRTDPWGSAMQGMAAGAQFGSQFGGGGAAQGEIASPQVQTAQGPQSQMNQPPVGSEADYNAWLMQTGR